MQETAPYIVLFFVVCLVIISNEVNEHRNNKLWKAMDGILKEISRLWKAIEELKENTGCKSINDKRPNSK